MAENQEKISEKELEIICVEEKLGRLREEINFQAIPSPTNPIISTTMCGALPPPPEKSTAILKLENTKRIVDKELELLRVEEKACRLRKEINV
ncbi:MAG: hypothetical protein M1834_005250 [Cirrosporium novae-zelandiae]|nr:MAG: hypothetical protein M1834_005250 [Cirrosporium novae-zelandiae]